MCDTERISLKFFPSKFEVERQQQVFALCQRRNRSKCAVWENERAAPHKKIVADHVPAVFRPSTVRAARGLHMCPTVLGTAAVQTEQRAILASPPLSNVVQSPPDNIANAQKTEKRIPYRSIVGRSTSSPGIRISSPEGTATGQVKVCWQLICSLVVFVLNIIVNVSKNWHHADVNEEVDLSTQRQHCH